MSQLSKKQMRIGLIVSLLLACAGIGAWAYQMNMGLQVTGLSNTIIWGLTIAVFFAIIAGGAGLLALCGLSEFLGFMDAEQRRKGIAFSIAAMVAGGILVIMDLGHPTQFFYLITSFNFASFSVLDFWFLSATLIVAVIYLIVSCTKMPRTACKALGVVAFMLSVGVIIIEGILLANNSSHHLWASSMSVVSFLVGAFLAGSALLAFIAPDKTKLFIAALIVSAAVTFAEVGTSIISGTDTARMTMSMVVAGSFAPYFYFQIFIGLLLPFILVIKTKFTGLASLAAILGIGAEKLWLLCAGETEIWGQFHHIGPAQVAEQFSYYPSLVEITLTVGALGIGVFLFLLITRFLPTPKTTGEAN